MKLLVLLCICHLVFDVSPEVNVQGCGKTSGCMQYPIGCKGDTCKMAARWTPQGKDSVAIEMTAHTTGYMSIGYSDDEEMGGDSVMACISDNYEMVKVVTSLNSHRGNDVVNDAKDDGISDVQVSLTGGWIWCNFTRRLAVTPSNDRVFDLGDDYYVMIAYGGAPGGVMAMHDAWMTSPKKLNVLKVSAPVKAKKRSNFVVYAHGLMAMAAWMCLVPIATVLGRHFKAGWPTRTLVGTKIWFTLHQYLTMSAIILTLVSITAILVKSNGYTFVPAKYSWIVKSHAPMGFAVAACSVFTALLSNVRCATRSPYRWMFNYSHMVFGIASLIMGLFCTYSGMKMMGMREICVYILSGYIIYLVATMFYLEFLRRRPAKSATVASDGVEDGLGKKRPAMTSPCEYLVIYSFAPITVIIFLILCVYMFRWLE